MSKEPRRALGRGLDALLPARNEEPAYGARAVFNCAIERIAPRRDQPRKHFDGDKLDELAATITAHGVIQPLVVRRSGTDKFELIAGERRWRAAQRAGLKEVPVVVKDVSPVQAFELALIENIQREDLNPIETAEAYARLCDDGNTQEAVAERVGKSRVTVTNALRLLKLPEAVRAMVAAGELSEGHARALLGASGDETAIMTLARKAISERISVRKLEELVRGKKARAVMPDPPPQKTSNVRDLETRLTRKLGARTTIDHHGPSGRIVVHYATLDELDRLLAVIDP